MNSHAEKVLQKPNVLIERPEEQLNTAIRKKHLFHLGIGHTSLNSWSLGYARDGLRKSAGQATTIITRMSKGILGLPYMQVNPKNRV